VAAQLEHTDKSSEPGCLSFKDLADVLSAQKSVPSLAQLDELIDRTKIGAEEVQPYLGFKAGNYSRHRVMKNEFVEMLVLCWKPGQRTPIHDHNGSHGAVFVHEGILWETMFDYDTETGLNYRSHRELRADGITSFSLIQNASDTRNGEALVIFQFDLLHVDGEDPSALPLVERKAS